MKNIIPLLAIASLFFLFSCESKNQITDPANQSEYLLSKKPDGNGKPNPGQQQVPIITLSINGEPILTDNAETNPEELITLHSNGSNNVSLSVSSAEGDPIKFISVEMRYDANVNHSIKPNSEFGGFIYRKDRDEFTEEDPTTLVNVNLPNWDLTLMPIASNDPTYKGNFIVTDQLSTPKDLVPTDMDETSDHYYFRVSVATENDPWHQVRNWKWVYNPIQPTRTLHIADVVHVETIANKRTYDIAWKALLHWNDENGVCNPLKNAEAYYWSDDIPEGNAIGRGGIDPSGSNGWQYYNNSLTKRDFPFNRYFIGVHWYNNTSDQVNNPPIKMSVYNPNDNHSGLGWYPSITVNSPND